MASRIPGRVIGGIIVTVGVLACLIALFPIIMLSWQMWNGNSPDLLMVNIGDESGGWSFSAWQFLGICGVVLLIGLGLVCVGVLFLFRSGRHE